MVEGLGLGWVQGLIGRGLGAQQGAAQRARDGGMMVRGGEPSPRGQVSWWLDPYCYNYYWCATTITGAPPGQAPGCS